MVYAFMGGVKYRTFLPSQNFHEINEDIAKTLIICDRNLLAQLLTQKFNLGVKRNMPHVTAKSAVLYPPHKSGDQIIECHVTSLHQIDFKISGNVCPIDILFWSKY